MKNYEALTPLFISGLYFVLHQTTNRRLSLIQLFFSKLCYSASRSHCYIFKKLCFSSPELIYKTPNRSCYFSGILLYIFSDIPEHNSSSSSSSSSPSSPDKFLLHKKHLSNHRSLPGQSYKFIISYISST